MEKRFIVKDVVSDYGVFDTQYGDGERLECICSARANADLIADILNTDYSKPNECTYYENELQQENKQLKGQLAEKDKEIEEYKTQIKEFCGTKLAKLIDKKEKEIRKQVCDEIREKLGMNECNTCENTAFGVYYDELKEILDQIEQAKENNNEHKSN